MILTDPPLSRHNPRIRRLGRLCRRRRDRHREGRFVLEGVRAVRDALERVAEGTVADGAVEEVYVEAGLLEGRDDLERFERSAVPVRLVDDGVIGRVATTVHAQGVLAVCRIVTHTIADLAAAATPHGLVVALDGIADPGNAGTIIRSVAAVDGVGVIVTTGAVDPWNPKTVRASAGTVLSTRLVETDDILTALSALRHHGFRVVAAVPDGGRPHTAGVFDAGRAALVVGSEAHGLTDGVTEAADTLVSIETGNAVESLNAAMAATVLVFEWARRFGPAPRPGEELHRDR